MISIFAVINWVFIFMFDIFFHACLVLSLLVIHAELLCLFSFPLSNVCYNVYVFKSRSAPSLLHSQFVNRYVFQSYSVPSLLHLQFVNRFLKIILLSCYFGSDVCYDVYIFLFSPFSLYS